MEPSFTNLNQALLAAMETHASQICFRVKQRNRYQTISYQRFKRLVFRLVHFFHQHGVHHGDRIVIAADNSLEWMVVYAACLLSGGVIVPVTPSMSVRMLQFILKDTEAKVAVLQNPSQIQVMLQQLDAPPDDHNHPLQLLLTISGADTFPDSPRRFSLKTLLAELDDPSPSEQETLRTFAEEIVPQSLTSIFYVAGDTRKPHGAVFDHARQLAAVENVAAWYAFEEDDSGFTLITWSELSSLIISLHYFLSGIPNAIGDSIDTLVDDMHATSPTIMFASPYTFARLYDVGVAYVSKQPESTQETFYWAMAKGQAYRAAGKSASQELRRVYNQADLTFFSRFRGTIGGRMRCFYSTGASLSQELADFFSIIGIPVLNIYSVAAGGGFPAVSRMDARRPNSCGKVAPGYQIRIASDGEILINGDSVMRVYWERPEETESAFDTDGWLRSGDLGTIDDDGYLYVNGRKPHTIVLSIGQKVSPAAIENYLLACPFIAQTAVFGDNKPYLSALIVPDFEAIARHLQQHTNGDNGEDGLNADAPQIKVLLSEAIADINEQLHGWEQIKSYRLLDKEFTVDANELTEMQDINRSVIAERYHTKIETMYPASTLLRKKEVTQVQVEPERLRELLEKEDILDAWMADVGIQFLLKLARNKGIDAPSMVHICDAAATIAQFENEEKPLSTALIIGDPVHIGRVLPPSQIQLVRHGHIRRTRKMLVTLAKMVDGLVLGYVIDKHGYVRGICKLEVDLPDSKGYLLGPQFRRHAAISEHTNAVVFFVPLGGKQVRVFANGQMVGRYSHGDWSADSLPTLDAVTVQLSQKKQYDLGLIRRVLRCAFQMSEQNLGAIFILGDSDTILARSDAPEISNYALIVGAELDKMSDQELINFAKQDGATVIDTYGKFRDCMILLRPKADTQAEIGPGKGARHSSAAKISAEADCLAITVSQDGPITLYDSGQCIVSL